MDKETIRKKLDRELDAARDLRAVEALRVRYLGRKGFLAAFCAGADFASMSDTERRAFGQELNALKEELEEAFSGAAERLAAAASAEEWVDLTVPGTGRSAGTLHPVTLVQMEAEDVLERMGFMILPGYEVETEHYNFDAVNTPPEHPARDMQDTYWLASGELLRTHTSANQVRVLERHRPPLRAAFPGRCFRRENVDASHENTFYQLEGMYVDEEVSIANLIAAMRELLVAVFRAEVSVRLRPGFFPWVEPGFELDLRCLICGGSGCPTCKGSGWVELLPCGLVHPRVLEAGGVDPGRYSGFAFGLGLTRLAMMRFGIPEIRLLNGADVRFCAQFPALLAARKA